MKNFFSSPRVIIVLSAALFYFLFFGLSAGINVLLLAGFSVFLFLFFRKNLPGKILYLLLSGMVVSSIAVVFAHSGFSIIIFWTCLVLFIGNFSYQQIRHLHYGILLSLKSVMRIPSTVIRHFSMVKARRNRNYTSYLRFIFIPIVTLIVIFILYSGSNNLFYQSFEKSLSYFGDFFSTVSFSRILFFMLGILIFSLCFVQLKSSGIIISDSLLDLNLMRKKRRSLIRSLNRLLLRKRQIVIVFFVLLNLMILWLNYLDITHIWFGFQWDGGYLKDMVHEGTYLLIAAIIVSIAVSVYYLNSNIVFMKNNHLFNALVIAWLVQNGIMIISVTLRNTIYIEHFALAYKRIFVYFFLIACFIGLLSIILMIRNKKSVGFLLSVNSVSLYLIILCSACFNWDGIIARYNFSHYNKSFVHYNFLIGMNDSALPYMDYSDEQLKEINAVQYDLFSFASSGDYTNINFGDEVKKRKDIFKKRWEHHNWLEWNYPEYRAYQLLFKQ